MSAIKSFASSSPVIFVLLAVVVWFILLMVTMGIASSAFHKPYGDTKTVALARLVVTAGIVYLLWRMGWLEEVGLTRAGSWQAWLLAAVGLIYFAGASLYSFYGQVAFDFSRLIRLPDSISVIATHFMAGLCEEILFRGLVLYTLIRGWGHTTAGLVGSVLLASLFFAVLHIVQSITNRVALASVLILVLQTWIISIWWGRWWWWAGVFGRQWCYMLGAMQSWRCKGSLFRRSSRTFLPTGGFCGSACCWAY